MTDDLAKRVRDIAKQPNLDRSIPLSLHRAADLIEQQAAEIATLKHDIERHIANHAADLSAQSGPRIRREALEEAAKACDALEARISKAMLDAHERNGTPIDGGYLNACDDCADAIRALLAARTGGKA